MCIVSNQICNQYVLKNYGYTHSCRFVVRSLWSTNPNFFNLLLPDNLDVDVLEKIGQHRFSLAFFAWFLASACAIMWSVISLSALACASGRLCSFSLSFCATFSVALSSSLSSEESVSCFPFYFFVGTDSFQAWEEERDASLPEVIL